MDVSTIAGAALQMSNSANRQTLSVIMVKQENEAQKQIVDMLQTLVDQQKPDPNFNVSVYA